VASVAVLRLDRLGDYCDLSGALDSLEAAAGISNSGPAADFAGRPGNGHDGDAPTSSCDLAAVGAERRGGVFDDAADSRIEKARLARHAWRLNRLAARVLRKHRQDSRADKLDPVVVELGVESWFPSDAPYSIAVSAVPSATARPCLDVFDSAGPDGVIESSGTFVVESAGTFDLKAVFPSAGVLYLDGAAVLSADRTTSFASSRSLYLRMDLASGPHTAHAVVVSDNNLRPFSLALLQSFSSRLKGSSPPREPVSATLDVLPHSDSLLKRRSTDGDLPCLWWTLAVDGTLGPELERALRLALTSTAWRLLALAAVEELPGSDEGDRRAIELLSSHDGDLDCFSALELVSRTLSSGETERAQGLLSRLDEICLSTAPGLLVQAESAAAQSWDALEERFVDEAYSHFPGSCKVLSRWHALQLDHGVLPPETALPVRCPTVERERDAFYRHGGASGEVPSPLVGGGPAGAAQSFRAYFDAKPEDRAGILAEILDRPASTDQDETIRALAFRDPQVPWALLDRFLAGTAAPEGQALSSDGGPEVDQVPSPLCGGGQRGGGPAGTASVREHRGAYGPLRAQAGRAGAWNAALPHLSDPETVAVRYLSSGFGAGAPQVLVLDEGVLMPSGNGWATYFESMMLHVVSADAAERIGEISLDAGQDLLELSVRKEDGTWLAPQYDADGQLKETVSLPGLSPGDLVLRTTVRELPLAGGTGGCNAITGFFFGGREHPVYVSRLVVLSASSERFVVRHSGALDLEDVGGDTWLFEKRLILPVPAEPHCPDPEAGLTAVHIMSRCFDWPSVRDRAADGLERLCDAPIPADAPSEKDGAGAFFRYVVEHVRPTGEGLLAKPASRLLAEGQGPPATALYCLLRQADMEAQLVAINSTGAKPVDVRRPGLQQFDGAAVRVKASALDEETRKLAAGMTFGDWVWMDPYDRTALPGYLRPSLRDRPGVVLSVRHPSLFIRSPEHAGDEGWKFVVKADAGGSEGLTGSLRIVGTGVAAAEMDVMFREESETHTAQVLQGILAQFVSRAAAGAHDFNVAPGEATLEIAFSMPQGGDHEVFLLLLAPAPMSELARLSSRTSPLYFPGILPMVMTVDIEARDGFTLSTATSAQKVESRLGRADLKVEGSEGRIVIRKTAAAVPRSLSPDEYPDFVRFARELQQTYAAAVEVSRERE